MVRLSLWHILPRLASFVFVDGEREMGEVRVFCKYWFDILVFLNSLLWAYFYTLCFYTCVSILCVFILFLLCLCSCLRVRKARLWVGRYSYIYFFVSIFIDVFIYLAKANVDAMVAFMKMFSIGVAMSWISISYIRYRNIDNPFLYNYGNGRDNNSKNNDVATPSAFGCPERLEKWCCLYATRLHRA